MTLATSWLARLARLLVVAIGLFAFAAPQPAQAESGEPTGWQLDRATERVIVGRLVFNYEPHLEDEARELIKWAPTWWSDVEEALAGDLDDRLVINFLDHSGQVSRATNMPKWVAGVAHPSTGEIVIARHAPDGSRTDLDSLLKHEMAHVALHRATGGTPLPRWFHEGVAESFSNEIDLSRAQTLAGAVFGPGVPDMERLEQAFFGAEGQDAAVAYAAARDLVTSIRYRDGNGSDFRQVLSELRLGHGFEASFIRAYGISLPELVGEWRAGLPGRFVWYALIAGGGLPFALVTPLVLVAWYRRKRILKVGFDRLEHEDALTRAAAAGA